MQVVPEEDIHVVVNVGDDTEIWGLHISPDIDSIAYALAKRLDTIRGWGLENETFRCLDEIQTYGLPSWFRLGDRDLGDPEIDACRHVRLPPQRAEPVTLFAEFGRDAHCWIDTHSAIRLDITLSAQPELAAVDFQPRNDAAAGIIEPVEFFGAEGCLVELDSLGTIGDGEPG